MKKANKLEKQSEETITFPGLLKRMGLILYACTWGSLKYGFDKDLYINFETGKITPCEDEPVKSYGPKRDLAYFVGNKDYLPNLK